MVSSSAVLNLPVTLSWDNDQLQILDQTRLPQESVTETLTNAYEVWRAIHELRVRGAPAIGVAAAYGLCVAVQASQHLPLDAFRNEVEQQAAYLDSARPTAVNLSWSLRRMQRAADRSGATNAAALYRVLVDEAQAIHREDQTLCQRIGEHGARLIRAGSGVLTHCNAGALATTGLGTATAPIYIAQRDGVRFRVFADETRPLLQGARLTAYELQRAGVDVTLITDGMAASMMAQRRVDVVIVGADRVAANGDFANKIGTLGLAIASRHFGVPFYVACPSSTLDLETADGAGIVIEERGSVEVTHMGGRAIAPPDINVSNPAFDVTPHDLVTGYITEAGIISPPFEANLAAQFGKAA